MSLRRVKDVRPMEVHAAKPRVLVLTVFDVDIAIESFQIHKLLGIYQISENFIRFEVKLMFMNL